MDSGLSCSNVSSMLTKFDILEALRGLASSDIIGAENLVVYTPESGKWEMQRNDRPFIVSIEGNIGAGKSTLLERLRELHSGGDKNAETYFGTLASKQIAFIQEPVLVWESFRDSVTGESILKKFYKDPKAYAFAFQVMAYNTILQGLRKQVKENPECALFICERSIDASRHIFTQMLRDDGLIDDVSFQVYMNMYDSNAAEFPLDAVLYLDVTPEVCLERVGKRSRDGEGGIGLEYLQECDKYYKKWLGSSSSPSPSYEN